MEEINRNEKCHTFFYPCTSTHRCVATIHLKLPNDVLILIIDLIASVLLKFFGFSWRYLELFLVRFNFEDEYLVFEWVLYPCLRGG
jgi:hypothetical protein